MKFVESLPADGRRKSEPVDLDALRRNTGTWAEIGRFAKEQRSTAHNRGQHLRRSHSDIEYTTRTVADEVILFVRAVSA